MNDIDSRIIIVLIGFFCGLSNLFVYCYFGMVANESTLKMNDCLYDSNWYGLPLDLQKMFPFLIRNTQQPLFYHGFGVVPLQLETLQRVSWFILTTDISNLDKNFGKTSCFQLLKTVFSYYMTLKATTTARWTIEIDLKVYQIEKLYLLTFFQ